MKKNKNKLLVLALILASFLILFSFPVKADSGFDSDFDFDYGDSGGGFDFDFDSGSGIGYYGPLNGTTIIIFIIVVIVVVIILIFKKNTPPPYIEEGRMSDEDVYNKLGSTFNYDEFRNLVFNNYVKIQNAWMNNKIEDVRDLLSDTIFNTYKTQLLTLETKNQQNIINDINYVGCYITGIQNANDLFKIEVTLVVTCKDYIIDKTNNNVLRGDSNRTNRYYYKLTFEKANIEENEKFCPNCGAKLPEGNSAKCEYCGSVIVKKSSNYILTDKKMIKQEIM